MKGKSFFLLNYEEVDELIKHCKVPNSMKDAFLLEIDNMLAAAVITIFSNYCDLKMYGGVPQINEVEGENLSHFIAKDLENLSNFKGICL